jgi:3-oxoacyl-[acyl-carrier protein] reductase
MASIPPSSSSSSSRPLAGRTAIVTGASRGIGRAIAAHLSSLGADVIIGYSSSPSPAEALASELTSSRAVPVKADVSDPAAVRSLFDTAESVFGRPVHILVLLYLFCTNKPFFCFRKEIWRRELRYSRMNNRFY